MLICELCGQRILGEMRQMRFRGSLIIVCEKCFEASTKMRNTTPLRRGVVSRKSRTRRPNVEARIEDKLEPVPDLGKIITERRVSLGLSIHKLSAMVGIRESLMKKVESGKMTLPIQELKKLERVLGISLLRVSEEETQHEIYLKNMNKKRDGSLTLGDLLAGK